MVEAQRGARLKYSVTQLCFSADSLGAEVTERRKTREKKPLILYTNVRPSSHRHPCMVTAVFTTGQGGLVRCCTGEGPPPPWEQR